MLKSIKGHENQEMTKEPSQAKRDRWNTQLNATCDSGLDFFSIKDIQQWDTGKIWIKSKDYVIIIKVNFLILWLYCGYAGEYPWL